VIDPAGRPDRPSPLRVTARCGSCRLPLQRLTASPRWTSTVTRARPGSRGVRVPFRGFFVAQVAPSWLPALPPRRSRRPRGLPCPTCSRDRGPGRSSPGVRVSFRAEPRLGCPRFGLAKVACATIRVPSQLGIASLGVLAPASTLRRVPRSTHPGRQAGAGRVRVAKPPPVPSSGFLPLSTVLAAHAARTNPLRSPPFAVTPRRFAALFHAARAPGVALQSFPLSRSRTCSRRPRASLRVRVRPPNGAADPRVSRPLSPIAPTSRRSGPEGFAGLEGRDDGSLESLGAARHALPRSFTTSRLVSAGLAGLGGRHARFEALLPSRVRSRDDRSLARARSSFQVGALLGFSRPLRFAFRLTQSSVLSRVCSSNPVGSVCATTNVVGTNPCLVRRENKPPGHAYSPGPRSGRGV